MSATGSGASSAEVRAALGHPVIDADGHLLELTPAAFPYLREHLSAAQFDAFATHGTPLRGGLAPRSLDERRRTRIPQSAWWGNHTENVLDRATAMFPALLHERLPEVGIDYGLFFTTTGMGLHAIADDELRRGLCAGWNAFLADLNTPYFDRLAFAGLIPMTTPDEAIAELRHCAAMGVRVVVFPEGVLRRIEQPDLDNPSPFLWPGQTHWFDTFGLDSVYDYDPVWATARELGYPVIFHGGLAMKPGLWTSISNYSHNHIGVFAQQMSAVVKSLYFGGVTRRFEGLPFAFLECGVSWGAQLVADIVEHWHKRQVSNLHAYDPSRLDLDELRRYYDMHGRDIDKLLAGTDVDAIFNGLLTGSTPDHLDDWAALGDIDEVALVHAFSDPFYFGCEADDRGVAHAFAPTNPQGCTLKAIFSSDIGHWDVASIDGLVAESHELVDDGALNDEQYRSFVYGHAAEMLTRANPSYFDGTALEGSPR